MLFSWSSATTNGTLIDGSNDAVKIWASANENMTLARGSSPRRRTARCRRRGRWHRRDSPR